MRISEVADQTGIPVSTIRYYEKRAIIPKPDRNGRDRSFSQKDVRGIQFVRDAQSLGLPLSEISNILQGSWSKGEMAKVAVRHRQTVRVRIKALKRIDSILAALETCRCDSVTDCNLNVSHPKRHD